MQIPCLNPIAPQLPVTCLPGEKYMKSNHRVSVTGSVALGLPAQRAVAFLHDIRHIAGYEPKVSSVRVTAETATKGSYRAAGRFAGLSWRGEFSYELTPRGFHSELVSGPPGVEVRGGFFVRAERCGGCVVTHYESYRCARWLAPLKPLLRRYLVRAMKEELRKLAEMIAGRAQAAEKRGAVSPVLVRF
jgi:hypothetical protein